MADGTWGETTAGVKVDWNGFGSALRRVRAPVPPLSFSFMFDDQMLSPGEVTAGLVHFHLCAFEFIQLLPDGSLKATNPWSPVELHLKVACRSIILPCLLP